MSLKYIKYPINSNIIEQTILIINKSGYELEKDIPNKLNILIKTMTSGIIAML
tara:strand:- start:11 stop:169 length:159 start_codon:yes stop_codon:yes gene_type:complete